MASQKELDTVYMECAVSMSKLSKAKRLKVGAVVVDGDGMISDGVNGTPAKFDNNCEDYVCDHRAHVRLSASEKRYICGNCGIHIADVQLIQEYKKSIQDAEFLPFAFSEHYIPYSIYGEPVIKEDLDNLVTKKEVLHAEANAIAKLARSTKSSIGSTLYTTHSPCLECSKLIIQAKIARVVYLEDYRQHDGLELLARAGIKVDKYEATLD